MCIFLIKNIYLFAEVFISNPVKYTAVGLLIRTLQSFTLPSTEASVFRRSSKKLFLKISLIFIAKQLFWNLCWKQLFLVYNSADVFCKILTTLSEEKKSGKNVDFFCQWRIFLPTIFYRRLIFTYEYSYRYFFTNENI